MQYVVEANRSSRSRHVAGGSAPRPPISESPQASPIQVFSTAPPPSVSVPGRLSEHDFDRWAGRPDSDATALHGLSSSCGVRAHCDPSVRAISFIAPDYPGFRSQRWSRQARTFRSFDHHSPGNARVYRGCSVLALGLFMRAMRPVGFRDGYSRILIVGRG